MPTTKQAILTSGETQEAEVPSVYVTYQQPLLAPTGNQTIDQIPGFLWLAGGVSYFQDSQGNILALAKNIDGSYPA